MLAVETLCASVSPAIENESLLSDPVLLRSLANLHPLVCLYREQGLLSAAPIEIAADSSTGKKWRLQVPCTSALLDETGKRELLEKTLKAVAGVDVSFFNPSL